MAIWVGVVAGDLFANLVHGGDEAQSIKGAADDAELALAGSGDEVRWFHGVRTPIFLRQASQATT